MCLLNLRLTTMKWTKLRSNIYLDIFKYYYFVLKVLIFSGAVKRLTNRKILTGVIIWLAAPMSHQITDTERENKYGEGKKYFTMTRKYLGKNLEWFQYYTALSLHSMTPYDMTNQRPVSWSGDHSWFLTSQRPEISDFLGPQDNDCQHCWRIINQWSTHNTYPE